VQVTERSVLQCVAAVCCSSVLRIEELREGGGVRTQCVAACCNVLQYVANGCSSVLQCAAAVCCSSMLQCVVN